MRQYSRVFASVALIVFALAVCVMPTNVYAFSDDYNGRVVLSKNFDSTKRSVGIMFEWELTYDLILLQQIMTQELIANGYTVVERLQIQQVLAELAFDQTGAVKEKVASVVKAIDAATSKDTKDAAKQDYSKTDLKKIGQMLGISHMMFFGLRESRSIRDAMYMRLVSLESGEIVATAFLSVKKYSDLASRPVARSVVKAMTESGKIASPIKDIAINFYTSREDYESHLVKIPVDKLLYQEDVNDNYVIVNSR